MVSLRASVVAAATLLFSLKAHSQAVYSIDPNSVPLSERTSWCQSQTTSCPLLCLQLPGVTSTTTDANDCDPTTLTYDCVCGNGQQPNASEYSQTLPYFICTEYGTQCVAGCGGNTACQSDCRSQHPCGAQDPTRVNATTTSATQSATTVPAGATSGTAGIVYTGLGGSAAATTTAASSTKSGAQTAIDLGRSYGLAIVFAGLFAGFALVM
ncbi:hypothetical protein BDZ45DRAFT_668732 [Acephala macrosclerotiorum]|nr:hypothetical protein BDZ45DRAFT_668732 [Acephala macrosclerotiorum]